MRRPLLIALVVLVGFVSVPPFESRVSAQNTVGVAVDVKCPSAGGRLEVSIDPWVYVRKQGEDAEWSLTTSGSDDRIEISAKGNRWPFPNRSHSGRGRVYGRNMKSNARGEYSYNVTVYCGSDKVVIDPKMIVDE